MAAPVLLSYPPLAGAPPIEWARYYVSLGFGLCHLEPGTKGPKDAQWNTPEKWLNTRERVDAQWAATPTHGMGLIHAASGTVAIDVDDLERTRHVFAEFGIDIDAVLGEGLRIRGKQSGRAKSIFRAPADGAPLTMHKAAWFNPADRRENITLFELRAGAVHDVLPPSQHPDGHRYEWLTGPWETGEVPILPAPLVQFWREWDTVADQIKAMSPWAASVTPIRPSLRVEEHNDVIGHFNRARSVDSLLQAAGYRRIGRRYLAPSSQSKLPGVSILSDGRVYSHHGSDPLADGLPHDAFDVFRILECNGDVTEATRRAGELLGIDRHVPSSHDFTALLANEGPGDPTRDDLDDMPEAVAWPAQLDSAALRGLAGKVVRLIEPHSEADPAGLLMQLLVSFGSATGRSPHYMADGSPQHVNLFALIVGATSSGRKGTSAAQVSGVFQHVDLAWQKDHVRSGLSSGEGLIYHVRDGRVSRNGDVDIGVEDKRLLAMETEFSSVLGVMNRQGNTLSAIIRSAWDTGTLSTLTKADPLSATGAHVSIIGHITPEELRKRLDATEVANGLLNRFLITAVRRSKYLPDGGAPPADDVRQVAQEIQTALHFARQVGVMSRDGEARVLWHEAYPSLTDRPAGMLGAATSRAAPQVLRLACIYALLDRSDTICRSHLESALAVWKYVEESTAMFLGRSLGDPVADAILAALRDEPGGLAKTAFYDLSGRHWKRTEIDAALDRLSADGVVCAAKEATKGRPRVRWHHAKYAKKAKYGDTA